MINEKTYWIGKVANTVLANHKAWATYVQGGLSLEDAKDKTFKMFNKDWNKVPEGCILGYDYLFFEE